MEASRVDIEMKSVVVGEDDFDGCLVDGVMMLMVRGRKDERRKKIKKEKEEIELTLDMFISL